MLFRWCRRGSSKLSAGIQPARGAAPEEGRSHVLAARNVPDGYDVAPGTNLELCATF